MLLLEVERLGTVEFRSVALGDVAPHSAGQTAINDVCLLPVGGSPWDTVARVAGLNVLESHFMALY